ncbi:MAG: hypothetical protein E4G94_08660, partial [ANME-2 cluster archaeon]
MSEKMIKEATPHVLRYIVPKEWSKAKKGANPIAAQEVEEAIKSGKDVEIINAVIDGPINLKSTIVEG